MDRGSDKFSQVSEMSREMQTYIKFIISIHSKIIYETTSLINYMYLIFNC